MDTTTRILRRLLDEPRHVEALRSLDTRRFGALVREASLEDAGELLAMATSAQTLAVLDDQLWRGGAGPQEQLDAERLAVWLEVLLEGGDALVARTLAALPEELLTAGLCGLLFVLELDALGHGMAGASWEEAEVAERVLDESLHLELDQYTLVARHALGWDPTIAALLALDREDHELVQRVLARCLHATIEELEEQGDGLHHVLRAQETLEDDARAEREDRRSRAGYVSQASARSFLALADRTPGGEPEALAEDPVTRAYFRELEVETAPGRRVEQRGASEAAPPASLRVLIGHLDGLDGVGSARGALPAGGEQSEGEESGADETAAVVALRQAMHGLHAEDPARHGQQVARLAYLANVLMAADRPGIEPAGPLEAGEQALGLVARGLERLREIVPEPAVALLRRFGVDGLFRLGWRDRDG